MSDCCAPTPDETRPTAVSACPTCGTRGKTVAMQTVKAQVRDLAQAPAAAYRFCATADCLVAYFPADDGREAAIHHADLREPVYQKAGTDEDVLVCYCFRYTRHDIHTAVQRDSAVAERITAYVRAGQCACEIRNPQGSCCLGNVRREEKRGAAVVTAD